MLSLIVLMITGSQIIVGFFKNTTEELIIEYHELHAIQEFKISLSNLLIFVNGFDVNDKNESEAELKLLIKESRTNLDICNQVLTHSHKLSMLDEFESLMTHLDNSVFKIYEGSEEEKRSTYQYFVSEIGTGIGNVDLLVSETKIEIEEYENRNQTVILHGTFTVISFGIILILILSLGGWRFIRNLTNPIKELVSATQRISKGDRQTKVEVNSNDEFLTLANAFNEMVDTLDQTTVSKDYLKNIINNMFNALVVTDKDCIIRSINNASLNMFGYKESDLIDQNILIIFGKDGSNEKATPTIPSDLYEYRNFINQQKHFITKNGKLLPVSISCSLLKNQNDEDEGLILVGHDLTEKIAYEERIEQNRKESLIALNEAQEEERIRIAIDLHDGLGQMLTAISYSLQELKIRDKGESQNILNIQNQIDNAIKEAKNLAHNLIPIVLKDFGLIAAIENLIMKANDTYDTKFLFNFYDYEGRIDVKLEKALYRICQESITNIIKHANAKNANVQLFRADETIVLVIDDDGMGFNMKTYEMNEKSRGIGLISIRERTLAFDGTFTIDSQTGNGTELIIEIPCRKN